MSLSSCEFDFDFGGAEKLKLQSVQNKFHRNTDNFPRYIEIRDFHTVFYLPYEYDYVTEL
jgi:hypothetical protein